MICISSGGSHSAFVKGITRQWPLFKYKANITKFIGVFNMVILVLYSDLTAKSLPIGKTNINNIKR
jgi:hypothetical protein